MRKQFPGYYRPSEDEFKKLWNECIFALDANVLLNLYRYSPATSESLIELLKSLSNRLWVPHQAALEYQRNRLQVIREQTKSYENLKKELHELENTLKQSLNKLKRHPFVQVDTLLTKVPPFFQEMVDQIERDRARYQDLLAGELLQDRLKELLTELLNGKVGDPYANDRLIQIRRQGEERYKNKVPPGYADAKKEDDKKWGDLILWFQLQDKAKTDSKPIILISDDKKDDWWLEFEGKTVGPRPELIQEFQAECTQWFYMYPTETFMGYSGKYLSCPVRAEAIEEIKEVKEELGARLTRMLVEGERSLTYSKVVQGWKNYLSAISTIPTHEKEKEFRIYLSMLPKETVAKLISEPESVEDLDEESMEEESKP